MTQLSAQAGNLPGPVRVGGPILTRPGNNETAPNIHQVMCLGFNNIVTVGTTFASYSAEVRKDQMTGAYTEAERAGIYFECVNGNQQTPIYIDPSDAPMYTAMAALLANYSTNPVGNAGARASYFRYDQNSPVSCMPGKPCYRLVGVYGYNVGG